MQATRQTPQTVWLRTNHPVRSIDPSMWNHLAVLESALIRGVAGMSDTKRPGFYEIEVGDNWYYIHIPSRISGVYLISVRQKSPANLSACAAVAEPEVTAC